MKIMAVTRVTITTEIDGSHGTSQCRGFIYFQPHNNVLILSKRLSEAWCCYALIKSGARINDSSLQTKSQSFEKFTMAR
jgi:hypothetical protein